MKTIKELKEAAIEVFNNLAGEEYQLSQIILNDDDREGFEGTMTLEKGDGMWVISYDSHKDIRCPYCGSYSSCTYS